MDGGSWHCTMGSDQDHPHEKAMQNGNIMRPHKELRRGVKLNTKGKKKTIHIWMKSPKGLQGEIKPSSVINANK